MFAKNLKYYRLKRNMTKKELASKAGVSSMAITHYENGERYPEMEIIKKLAIILDVGVVDFISSRNKGLVFEHEEFRRNSRMSKMRQEYIHEAVEEYFSRFFDAVEMLGGEVLPQAPGLRALELSDDIEANGKALRRYLGVPEMGPAGNLVEILENKGILLYMFDSDDPDFSGLNGTVNGRPYIAVNKNMTPERVRTTIVHEASHFAFNWPSDMDDKTIEKTATAIGGAFLFPKEDALRELGIKRSAITKDMIIVCKEYGISLSLLAVRAKTCRIISETVYRDFFIALNSKEGRKNEKSIIQPEESRLFEQLVYRAVNEEGISIQRGAELLKVPYDVVAGYCGIAGV